MKILIKPPHERPDYDHSGFTEDLLERKPIAQNLTWLLKSAEDGLVISLEAAWGEGKTTFLRLWQDSLDTDDVILPIYYNSFENDFSNDAFISIAGTIHKALEKEFLEKRSNRQISEQLRHLRKAAASVAGNLVKVGASGALSALTAGMISSKDIQDWTADSLERLAFETLQVDADAKLEAYLRSDQARSTYQDAIRQLLENHSQSHPSKIVVLVDELDRCRPTFAVEVIEKIKHLFRATSVHFVLAIHRDQILQAIAGVYGVVKENASTYLEKFLDLSVPLPALGETPTPIEDSKKEIINIERYFRSALEQLDLLSILPELESGIPELADLAAVFGLSPRAINRAATLIALTLASSGPEKARDLQRAAGVAAVLKVGSPADYQKIRKSGVFDSIQLNIPKKLLTRLLRFFGAQAHQTAGNLFEVYRITEVCRILEMYRIPGQERSTEEAD